MENLSCRRGVVVVEFWMCNGGVSEVLLCGGTWRLFGPRSQGLFPFFPSLSLPSKLPSCSLPFHSLSFFLFPPCQSPTLKSLSSQFSPPMILSILLFYRPVSPFLPSPFYSSSLSHVQLSLPLLSSNIFSSSSSSSISLLSLSILFFPSHFSSLLIF